MCPLESDEYWLSEAEPRSCLRRQKTGEHHHIDYTTSFLAETVYLTDQIGVTGRCPDCSPRWLLTEVMCSQWKGWAEQLIRSVSQRKIMVHVKNPPCQSSPKEAISIRNKESAPLDDTNHCLFSIPLFNTGGARARSELKNRGTRSLTAKKLTVFFALITIAIF